MDLHQRIIDGLRALFLESTDGAAASDPSDLNARALKIISSEIARAREHGEMPVVVFERGALWIKKNNQSFKLAYDADDQDEWHWYQDTLSKVLGSVLPPCPVPHQPAAYADAWALSNFKDEVAPKEYMWAKRDAGQVPLYTEPQDDNAFRRAVEKRIEELAKSPGDIPKMLAHELQNLLRTAG